MSTLADCLDVPLLFSFSLFSSSFLWVSALSAYVIPSLLTGVARIEAARRVDSSSLV